MKRSSWIVNALVLCCVTSCASFRAGELAPLAPSQPSVEASLKPSIAIVVSGAGAINGAPHDINASFVDAWTKTTVKAYSDSNLFSSVLPGPGDADLRAEILIRDEGKVNLFLSFLTGFTFFALPSSATDRFVIRTVLKDRDGRTLGEYEKMETVTTWTHALLIPLMPFRFPSVVTSGTLADLSTSTLQQARLDGVL